MNYIDSEMNKIISEIESIPCAYHGIQHIENYDHSVCIIHGHCLNPMQCNQFKDCPMHINGKNMSLAWSSLKR